MLSLYDIEHAITNIRKSLFQSKEDFTIEHNKHIFNALFIYAMAAELFTAMGKQIRDTERVIPEIKKTFTKPANPHEFENINSCNDTQKLTSLCEEQGKEMAKVANVLKQSYVELFYDGAYQDVEREVFMIHARGHQYAIDIIKEKIISRISIQAVSLSDHIKTTLPEVRVVNRLKNDGKLILRSENDYLCTKPNTANLSLGCQTEALKLYSYAVIMKDVVYPYMNLTAQEGSNPKSALSKHFIPFPENIYDYIGYLCRNDKQDGNIKITFENHSLNRLTDEDEMDENPGQMFGFPPLSYPKTNVKTIKRGPLAELVLAETPNPARIIASHRFGLYDALNLLLPNPIQPQNQNG